MTTITPKRLFGPTQLAAAAATLYTTPSTPSTTTRLTELSFCNTDTVEHAVTVRIVPSGQTTGVAFDVVHALSISAGETIDMPKNTVLNAGDFIDAFADVANKVNLIASGAEIA